VKKARNGFVINLRIICFLCVSLLGFMTIVGTGGGGGESDTNNGMTQQEIMDQLISMVK